MMRTQAVLNLLEVFPATSEIRHDARAKTQNVVAYPSDTWYAFANGAEAQNREPHERRIGDGDGKVD